MSEININFFAWIERSENFGCFRQQNLFFPVCSFFNFFYFLLFKKWKLSSSPCTLIFCFLLHLLHQISFAHFLGLSFELWQQIVSPGLKLFLAYQNIHKLISEGCQKKLRHNSIFSIYLNNHIATTVNLKSTVNNINKFTVNTNCLTILI